MKNKSLLRKVGRMLVIFLAIVLIAILLLTGYLLMVSPGKPKQFLDENGNMLQGSVSEKIHVEINGIQQGMFILSQNKQNPILLFVHGGPGMPEYFLFEQYATDLADYFTVCLWAQRGAGLSYSSDIPLETLTVEQFVEDTIAVTKYLSQQFQQEKIFLMAHSWGTFFAIQAAQRAPQLYHAYIGMAQIVNVVESEKEAYIYMRRCEANMKRQATTL